MIEIAISLAIIGFALVAIILALPWGLNAQRDNRQQTIIGQDAAALIELIRNGSRGADDLTNYVYLVSNTVTVYNVGALSAATHVYGYTFGAATYDSAPVAGPGITNGAAIIGLMSAPEIMDPSGNPTNNLYSGGYSNHVTAYLRCISGLAAEKPPQNNSIMVDDTFKYRIYIANTAVAQDTNVFNGALPAYNRNFSGALRELRLTFRWPVLPNGAVADQGASPLTFRASVGGTLQPGGNLNGTGPVYYYQPQVFAAP